MQLTVSSSPHIRAEENTRSIMIDVCIALFFPFAISVYYFGPRAAIITVISVISCIFFEWSYRKIMHKTNTIGDLSAVVTGMLFSFCLPVSVPYWIPVVGSFFAIVIVKQLYGGLGKNFLNPALAARAFLMSWPAIMTTWTKPMMDKHIAVWGNIDIDAISTATPLQFLKQGTLPTGNNSLWNLFLGDSGGSYGEVSAAIILLAGVYLVVRKVITPRIPLSFIGTVAALTFLFPRGELSRLDSMTYNLVSGGLMLGAVFMATDYSTSPVTKRGQILFGIGCGALTVFIRYFGGYPEGVCFSILMMNAVVWMLDKTGFPRRFGIKSFAKLTAKLAESKKGGQS